MSYTHFEKEFVVDTYFISPKAPPFLVAEIGLNHNNDLELAKRTISAAKKSGAKAVKFQSYITEEFIDKDNLEAKFLFDIFKTYELSEQDHTVLHKTARDEGLIFFSTPLCESAVDLLVSLKVPVIKIASGDIVNKQLLKKVTQTKLPIFLSTGASDFFEVVRAIDFLKEENVTKLCLLHCVSMYPTPYENVNLHTLLFYKEIFSCPIGFSDHSAGNLASAIAVGLDACVIEKHFTLDKTLPGPDHSISLNPEEFSELAKSIELAFLMKGERTKKLTEVEKNGRFYGRRSLYQKNQKFIALRPALHLKQKNIADSWFQKEIE